MKIGFISDIHANEPALDAVLTKLDELGVDEILCAGDIVGYYTRPGECINTIRSLDIPTLKGNHDEALVSGTPGDFNIYAKRAIDWNRRQLEEDQIDFLKNLSQKHYGDYEGTELMMVHGSPSNPLREYVFPEDITEDFIDYHFRSDAPDVLVLGHTHKPFARTVLGTTVINPGSVGQPRDGDPRAGFATYDTRTQEVEHYRIEYEIEELVQEIHEYLPRKLADRLKEGK